MVARSWIWAIVALMFMACPLWALDEDEGAASLNADELSFDEASGIAVAEGNAALKYKGIRMFADKMEMDTVGNVVKAYSVEGKGVTLISGGKVMRGQRAEFDLTTREGALYETSSAVPLSESDQFVYIKGEKMEVSTVAAARRKGWLPKKTRALSDDEAIGRWEGVSVTTCSAPHPHYRLKAKRLVLIPDEKVVVNSPQVYIGDSLLFTYPFDYRVDLQEHGDGNSFMPKLGYDSDKGIGLGVSGPFYWDRGRLSLSVMGWSDEGLEWSGRIDQELAPWLRIYGETAWEYESSSDRKEYRPSWGFVAENDGWTLDGRWTQREALKEELRAGRTYKTTLWRMPELSLSSPWWRISSDERQYFRMGVQWGRYEETGKGLPEMERFSWGGELYGKIGRDTGRWEPFWRFAYRDFSYDVDVNDRQKVTDASVGAVYRSESGFEAGTAYVRRWVDGRSPFALVETDDDSDSWDDYDEEELIYQRFGFSLSDTFRLRLTGAYDLDRSRMDEIAYQLTYQNNCCYKWILTYRDDRHDDDDWASLSFQLTAFPDNTVRFSDNELDDPFEEPRDLPKD
jgi:LPS-assembly protein